MWPHWCDAEQALIMTGDGEECSWCGARPRRDFQCDEPEPEPLPADELEDA